MGENKAGIDDDRLVSEAEELIAAGELKQAQKKLNLVKEKSARAYYVQSKLFLKKKWTNEARKQLEKAMELDSENAEYAAAYEELNRGDGTLNGVKKQSDMDKGACAECCCLGSVECCAEGVCSVICDGCS